MSAVSNYSKLEVVERHLEAALLLMLRGFDPAPVHTLIAAARGVLYGLSKHDPNLVLAKWDNSILSKLAGPNQKDIRRFQNRAANFLKHADRDPDEALEGYDLDGLNRLEIQICICALVAVKGSVSKPLDIALLYFGFSEDAIVNLEAHVEQLYQNFPALRDMREFGPDIWGDALVRLLEASD